MILYRRAVLYLYPRHLSRRVFHRSVIRLCIYIRACAYKPSNLKSLVPRRPRRLIPASELISSFVPIILSVIYDRYSVRWRDRNQLSSTTIDSKRDSNSWFLLPIFYDCMYVHVFFLFFFLCAWDMYDARCETIRVKVRSSYLNETCLSFKVSTLRRVAEACKSERRFSP